jgi:hypothetical protein
MHRLKGRLTYGNVIATIALFVALGGSSYAAITLPRNSVGANQLRTGSVRSSEVKDRTLNARDLSQAARRFLRSQDGAQGPRGPQGPQGPQGERGLPGTTPGGNIIINIESAQGTVGRKTDPDIPATAQATATCSGGTRVIGGGVNLASPVETTAHDSYPVGANAWRATVANDDDMNSKAFTVYAICTP